MGMESVVLSREVFERWLRRRSPGSCVGRLGDEADCPLARCLSIVHARAVVVSASAWWFADQGIEYRHTLAPWARAFVSALDELPRATVSRERALSTLERVIR